jgi:mRNA interferase RelE/StbE
VNRSIEWKRRALDDIRDIRRHDPSTADRIGSAIEAYAVENRGDARKLAGSGDIHRLRVGDWRILFVLEGGGRTIGIVRVINRRDAYRD